MSIVLDGTAGMTAPQGAIYNGLQTATAVASTSGTSIDFTGIPSWAKRITLMWQGVSTSGTSQPMIQVGSGSVATTGYLCGSTFFAALSAGSANYTNGFQFFNALLAADIFHGNFVFTNISGNNWTMAGNFGLSNVAGGGAIGGSVTLAGVLDRVRITTANGTDTFDAGSINIMYE